MKRNPESNRADIILRKDTDPSVKEFIFSQSNLNDAILFLIEKEIFQNGVRDLAKFIPKVRSDEFFDSISLGYNSLHTERASLNSDKRFNPSPLNNDQPIVHVETKGAEEKDNNLSVQENNDKDFDKDFVMPEGY